MEFIREKNKKVLLIGLVIILIIIIFLVTIFKNGESTKMTVEDIISKNQEALVFVENSNNKKCSNCREIKKYLDKEKIEYILYDMKKHSDDEYIKMLQSLSINPSDFSYPAVIYIKKGKAYADLINIKQTDKIDGFIKKYNIKK